MILYSVVVPNLRQIKIQTSEVVVSLYYIEVEES